jgi:hypothetical protein
MKKLLLCAATFTAMGSVAMAYPVKLTDTQLGQIVAGNGNYNGNGNGTGNICNRNGNRNGNKNGNFNF